jgi:uncharacterized membrane protein YkvA (DUF1232 family)
MTTPSEPPIIEYDFERADRFYSRVRVRIVNWLRRKPQISDSLRAYLLLLPDLFALLVRLIRDPRIDMTLKTQLIAVSAYVISPIDLVPDFLLPLGLSDDVLALAFVLSRVLRIMEQAGAEILREHWDGEGDILAQIERAVDAGSRLLNSRTVQRLSNLVGRGGKGRAGR